MIALDRRLLNFLIPYRSPSFILNVVADLGLSLLVHGSRPFLVPLLPLVPFSLHLLFWITLSTAFALDSISKGIDSSPFHLPASQALVPLELAPGDSSVPVPPVDLIPLFLLISGSNLFPLHLFLCCQQC